MAKPGHFFPIRFFFTAAWLCWLPIVNGAPPLTGDQAMQSVKIQACKDGLTIEQVLDQSVKSNFQRDIGWRYFLQEDYIDVERSVLINKGMETRYRWRIDANGNIKPQTDRAEKLCS